MPRKLLDTLNLRELHILQESLKLPDKKTETKKELRERISKELAKRLCRCEIAVSEKDPNHNYERAIAICISSILHNRGVKIQSFQCRGTPSILSTKTFRPKSKRNQRNKTKKQKQKKL